MIASATSTRSGGLQDQRGGHVIETVEMVQTILLGDGATLAAGEEQNFSGNDTALKIVVLFLYHAILRPNPIELGNDGFRLRLAL
mgnify:CR=1 FL=1